MIVINRTPTLLLLLALITLSSAEQIIVNSVVYDCKVYDNNIECFSLISIKRGAEIDNFHFYSPVNIELITENLEIEKVNNSVYIKGLSLKNGENISIILKFRNEFQGNDVKLSTFTFPYKVERTLIAVNGARDKLVWTVGFPAYSLDGGNKVLIRSDVTDEDINQMNYNFESLRKSLSKQVKLPEYRIYLNEIQANENIAVKIWAGKSYQYYLPNTLTVILISGFLFLIVYLILSRKFFISESEKPVIPIEEERPNWEDLKAGYEDTLNTLKDDEYIIYKEIFDSRGEILQRNLPEKTGFSKAKVTRVLDRLDQKKLIERRSYGITNKVVLK